MHTRGDADQLVWQRFCLEEASADWSPAFQIRRITGRKLMRVKVMRVKPVT